MTLQPIDLLREHGLQVTAQRLAVMRALTAYGESFDVEFFASARFVADLCDPDKVQAVVAGGVVDRQFHAHQQDQIQPWAEGKLLDWWFAPAQVEAHAVQRQELVPADR